jgi:hypothetical protein
VPAGFVPNAPVPTVIPKISTPVGDICAMYVMVGQIARGHLTCMRDVFPGLVESRRLDRFSMGRVEFSVTERRLAVARGAVMQRAAELHCVGCLAKESRWASSSVSSDPMMRPAQVEADDALVGRRAGRAQSRSHGSSSRGIGRARAGGVRFARRWRRPGELQPRRFRRLFPRAHAGFGWSFSSIEPPGSPVTGPVSRRGCCSQKTSHVRARRRRVPRATLPAATEGGRRTASCPNQSDRST